MPPLLPVLDTDVDPALITPTCPQPVRRAVMVMEWNTLTFLHWRVDPAAVQRLLPDGLRVETFAGEAWVGLVPFEMKVTVARTGYVPWASNFPETNVRTYVRGPDGTTGVWFLSLDAARFGAVVAGITSYGMPYKWSAMSVHHLGDVVSYRCRRRWPAPRGARSGVAVRVGEPFAPDELGLLDHWLTARWRLYSASERGVRGAWAEHPVWPLHRAELLHLDDELVRAAGFEVDGPPLVHWSPGVQVRVSLPARCVADG